MNLTLTYLAVILLWVIRAAVVLRVSLRRLDAIAQACERDMPRADFFFRLQRRYDEFKGESELAMLLDLRRWTYRQFYPKEPA
jgi:hypothetical protein